MVPLTPNLYLQPSLDRLRIAILEQNKPGSVEGLLAQHFLTSNVHITIEWQVGCTRDWVSNDFKPTNLDHVAALGYFLWSNPHSDFTNQLLDGLSRVRERDPFKGEHLSLARNPTRLLGIILGCLALGNAAIETLNWCQNVLERIQQKDDQPVDPLMPYLIFRAFGTKTCVTPRSKSLYDLSLYDWFVRHAIQADEPSLQQLRETRQRILFQAATDLRFESTSQAAVVWDAVTSSLFHALGEASLQARDVIAVLNNFEAAMKRWRSDAEEDKEKPIRWPIMGEREIQDILWLILRSYFPDVIDEDALPKLGHSTYKADFGIGSLKLIVEAKFATSREDFKKIEKEIQEDCIPYLRATGRYESIVVFIYDDSASVQEHDTTRVALQTLPGVVGVVIASRPSQVSPTRASRSKNRPRNNP